MALVASSAEELTLMMERLSTYCYDRGLTINLKKCQVLHVPAKNSTTQLGQTFPFQPSPSRTPSTIEVVKSFKYLGIPITSTLDTKQIADAAINSIWSGFHAGQEAGMLPDGLSPPSRAVAWSAFVLPHILFYLPFLTRLQMLRIDSVANSTLRLAFNNRASAEALRAELGLLQTEALWSQLLARVHGRLHTNHVRMRAAKIYTQLVAHHPTSVHHLQKLLSSVKLALHYLDLKDHWPHPDTNILPAPTRDEDLRMATTPNPGAAPGALWRHTWGLLVDRHTLTFTNKTFARLLTDKDHRLHSYQKETLSGMPVVPSQAAKASWLLLKLPRSAQTTLLKLRTLASDLA